MSTRVITITVVDDDGRTDSIKHAREMITAIEAVVTGYRSRAVTFGVPLSVHMARAHRSEASVTDPSLVADGKED